ncbi:hypothetical protein Tco_1192625 [Tanacetum coccineum]
METRVMEKTSYTTTTLITITDKHGVPPTKRLFRVTMLDPSQGFIDPWGKFGDLELPSVCRTKIFSDVIRAITTGFSVCPRKSLSGFKEEDSISQLGWSFDGISSRCEVFPDVGTVTVLENSWASFIDGGPEDKRIQRSFLVLRFAPCVPTMIGCEVLGSFSINDFEVKFLEEENPFLLEQSRSLDILFCKEYLRAEWVRMHYAFVHDEKSYGEDSALFDHKMALRQLRLKLCLHTFEASVSNGRFPLPPVLERIPLKDREVVHKDFPRISTMS